MVNGEMAMLDEMIRRIVAGFRYTVKGLFRGLTLRYDKQRRGRDKEEMDDRGDLLAK